MKRFRRVSVSPGFFLLLGLLFWWDPPRQALCILFCAALHEAGHLAAAALLKSPFRGLSLGFFGWELDLGREKMPYRREIPVDLAGPLANFLGCAAALFFIRQTPTREGLFFFFCNALFGLLQLLPAPTLDGGRALLATLSLFLPRETAEKIVTVCGFVTAVLLFSAGLLIFFQTKNPSLLLFLPGATLPRCDRRAPIGLP